MNTLNPAAALLNAITPAEAQARLVASTPGPLAHEVKAIKDALANGAQVHYTDNLAGYSRKLYAVRRSPKTVHSPAGAFLQVKTYGRDSQTQWLAVYSSDKVERR